MKSPKIKSSNINKGGYHVIWLPPTYALLGSAVFMIASNLGMILGILAGITLTFLVARTIQHYFMRQEMLNADEYIAAQQAFVSGARNDIPACEDYTYTTPSKVTLAYRDLRDFLSVKSVVVRLRTKSSVQQSIISNFQS